MPEDYEYLEEMYAESAKADTLSEIKEFHLFWDPSSSLTMASHTGCFTELFEAEETAYLADYYALSKEISKLIKINDKDMFASFIVRNHDKIKAFPASEVFVRLCISRATACVAAFLDSEFGSCVDLNDDRKYVQPLVQAAGRLSYSFAHLLLSRGALVNGNDVFWKALSSLTSYDCVRRWADRGDSLFKFIKLLESSELDKILDIIELLASHTEQAKLFELCLSFILNDRIIYLCVLLYVCWDKLLVPSCDLENTPIVQFILTELAQPSELKMYKEEDIANVFNVIEIFRLHRMLENKSKRDIAYRCLLLKLTSESQVLSRKIFSRTGSSTPHSSSFVGVQKPALGTDGLQFSQIRQWSSVVHNQISRTTPLKSSSSRNYFTLAGVHAPLLWRIVKRCIK